MSEWQIVTLGEVTDWYSGGTPKKGIDAFWNGDIPWISAKTLKGTRVSKSEVNITQLGLENGSRLAIKNDLLLLVRGSGLFNSIPIAIVEKPLAFNQDIKAIRIKEGFDHISPWYILYWLHANKRTLNGIMEETGIGAGKFDTNLLKSLSIEIPPKSEMDDIFKTIKSIDDKITLLREQNETLEELAQTLFKRWFVEFEFPISAEQAAAMGNAELEGKPYKSSGGKMIESELGEIPDGWRVSNIDSLVELIIDYRGKTPKKLGMEWSDTGIPALSAKTIKKGKIVRRDAFNYGSEKLYEIWMKDELRKGDILLTSEAPLGELYYLADETKYILSQRLFAIRCNDSISSQYLYFYLFSNMGQYLLRRRASGSTVEGIRQSELREVEIIVPVDGLLEKATGTFNSVIEKTFSNQKEIQSLTQLRDTLLPKLMSGELRVKN